tara:strand:- start:180 stop:419 length:240 start_codon:yes stop_codon:yes gene_type:complete
MAIKFLSSQIGKKIGMSLTGLALYGFLVGHLAGNLLLIKGDNGEAFNEYAILRWNSSARIIMEKNLKLRPRDDQEHPLE